MFSIQAQNSPATAGPLARIDYLGGVSAHYSYALPKVPNATSYVYGADGLLAAEYRWDGNGWSRYLRLPNGAQIALARSG